jgi:hypothetical protein
VSIRDEAGPDEGGGDFSDRDGDQETTMWIFHGEKARYASGLFATAREGLAWLAANRVSGVLTEYAVGSTYDVAVRDGRFRPSRPHHGTPEHVAAFSPGLRHFHVIDGQVDR